MGQEGGPLVPRLTQLGSKCPQPDRGRHVLYGLDQFRTIIVRRERPLWAYVIRDSGIDGRRSEVLLEWMMMLREASFRRTCVRLGGESRPMVLFNLFLQNYGGGPPVEYAHVVSLNRWRARHGTACKTPESFNCPLGWGRPLLGNP